MLALSLPQVSWAHRIPVGWKFLGLCLFTMAIFPVKSVAVLALALGLVGLLYISLGKEACMAGVRHLKPLWVFVLVIALWHLATWTLVDGIRILLRLTMCVALANFVTMTSRLDDMINMVKKLLSPFRRLGVNVHLIGLAFALVIRFVPVLGAKGSDLVEAWRARSAKRPNWRLILPFCLLAIDDADNIAEALKARGGAELKNQEN